MRSLPTISKLLDHLGAGDERLDDTQSGGPRGMAPRAGWWGRLQVRIDRGADGIRDRDTTEVARMVKRACCSSSSRMANVFMADFSFLRTDPERSAS